MTTYKANFLSNHYEQLQQEDKELVIMAGLPASGKSTIRAKMFNDYHVIDCDEIKKGLEGYDPKNPEATHAQSKVLEKQAIYNALAEGKTFLYDTTATNSDKVVKLTRQAQELGYTVTLCYVKVSLATSLKRNAMRERSVNEAIILEKYSLINQSIEIEKQFVNCFVEIEND